MVVICETGFGDSFLIVTSESRCPRFEEFEGDDDFAGGGAGLCNRILRCCPSLVGDFGAETFEGQRNLMVDGRLGASTLVALATASTGGFSEGSSDLAPHMKLIQRFRPSSASTVGSAGFSVDSDWDVLETSDEERRTNVIFGTERWIWAACFMYAAADRGELGVLARVPGLV